MKRILLASLAVVIMLITLSPSAQADALLTITVNATTVSCNTSAAFTAANCGAGFVAVAGGSTVSFTGTVGGVALGNAAQSIVGVQLTNNQPGSPTFAFATDTKTVVNNTTGSTANVNIGFAVNGFMAPNSPNGLSLTAAQGVDVITSPTAVSESFTGFGNSANTLIVGGTAASVTPLCTAPPGISTTCSTNTSASPTLFMSGVPFALAGNEVFSLANGAQVNAHASVAVSPVPESSSLLLFGTGMLLIGGRRLRRKK